TAWRCAATIGSTMLKFSVLDRTTSWIAAFGSIVALCLGGCGGSGGDSTATRPRLTAPTGLTASAGNTTVQLTWSSVVGATGYVINRDGASVGSPSATSFADSGLTNGTAYTYTVSATNGTDTSASSAPVTATHQAPLSAPGTPSSLTATAGDSSVSLAWSASAGAMSYQVFRDGAVVGSTATNSYSDSGLTNGTTYAYTVSAVNSAGASPESAAVSATPTGAPKAPAAPTGLVATAANATITLTWDMVTGATGYHVYRNGTAVGSPATNSFTDTGLTNGTAYQYAVTASNSAGSSPQSASITATPNPQVPATPAAPSATVGNGSVVLSWQAV